MHQVLIGNELVINKSKQKSKLLIDNLILASAKPFCKPAGKLRLQERAKKRVKIEAKRNGLIVLEKSPIVKEKL